MVDFKVQHLFPFKTKKETNLWKPVGVETSQLLEAKPQFWQVSTSLLKVSMFLCSSRINAKGKVEGPRRAAMSAQNSLQGPRLRRIKLLKGMQENRSH